MRRKTNTFILAGILIIFICTYSRGEQSFVEMMKAAETNCSPIVVELGVIDHGAINPLADPPPTVSPKNSDYTSTEKWFIAGSKYRYEQSLSFSNKKLTLKESIVSVYDGTEYKKLKVRTLPSQKKFGYRRSTQGDSPRLSEHVFGHFEVPWSALSDTKFTTNYVENGVAVIGCMLAGRTPIRIEIATNKSGFVEAMQIRNKNDTNAIILQIETEIAQWGHSSNWFPRVHRFYGYGTGHKRLEKEVFVKSVQFDAIISNEVFQLSFPQGTKVWNGSEWEIRP